MNLENIKELVRIFKNADYRDLFGALVINEKIDYLQDLEDLQEKDLEYLEELYNNFIDRDLQLIDLEWLLTYDTSNKVQVDYEDLKAFYKLNNKEKDIGKRLYNINGSKYDIKLLKNVIDIIGEVDKVYYIGEEKPLYFENNEGEIGLVLPVRTF